ncbi:MAP7 domain-containing protein 2 isoform X3 [Oncorhynchus mykiss]|uniref:MAP7 domain-containing protein 2 isoform X3 n=1 Tax=Oncorhynchus mykiss TaxID=8022 RepID=UPI001877A2DB|nr:MAP7 domain-containing protein 2 isoform X3 [Oncorhynchus mykiss]
MPCSVPSSSMAVIQEKQRETPSKKPVSQEDRKGLSTRDNQDNQKDSRSGRQGEKGNDDMKPRNSEKRRAVICVPASIKSAVISNNTSSHGNPAGPQALKVDERLRLAKERREEHEKQLVSRELGWLAREERARRLYEQQLEERKRRLQEQREKEEKRRTALERREEHQKQLVSRELGRLAREERAMRHYEQQMEERKRRLQEQREKEARRRTAVEEKRRQRMKEESERYESVVKKTLEKSQRIKQRLSQGSRGRKTDNKSAPRRSPLTAWERALVSRLLTPTCSYLARSRSRSHNCQSREEEVVHICPRSVSCHSMPATATNSHKSPRRSGTTDHHLVQADLRTDYRADYRSIIQANYQVATSPSPSRTSHRSINAAQLKAAQQEENERTARRNTQQPYIPNAPLKALPTNPLPNTGVKVLPTNPQCSATVPSPERKPVIRHTSVIRQPLSQQLELELDPVPEEDTVPVPDPTLSPGNSQASQTISPGAPVPNPTLSPGNSQGSQTISPGAPVPNPTLSPGNSQASQTISPGAPVPNPTLSPGNSQASQTISPGAPVPNPTLSPGNSQASQTISPGAPVPNPTLSPGNSRPIRTPAAVWDQVQPFLHSPEPQTQRETTLSTEGSADEALPPGATPSPRPSAGTMDPEEASRLLAEKRREARLKREREEEESLRREEFERRGREELERRRVEQRARLEAEAKWLVEERKRREEEEQKHAEEERASAEEEKALRAMQEAALLQKQREEEETQAREKAEQQRLEREKHFQEEEEQRQERKKRLELIMRRTRKENSIPKKPILNGNSNGNSSSPEEAQPKENTEPVKNIKGTLEEVGTGTKPSKLGLCDTEDMVPVVAFKERRSLRTLTGMEEIQSHQRAGESSLPDPPSAHLYALCYVDITLES